MAMKEIILLINLMKLLLLMILDLLLLLVLINIPWLILWHIVVVFKIPTSISVNLKFPQFALLSPLSLSLQLYAALFFTSIMIPSLLLYASTPFNVCRTPVCALSSRISLKLLALESLPPS